MPKLIELTQDNTLVVANNKTQNLVGIIINVGEWTVTWTGTPDQAIDLGNSLIDCAKELKNPVN